MSANESVTLYAINPNCFYNRIDKALVLRSGNQGVTISKSIFFKQSKASKPAIEDILFKMGQKDSVYLCFLSLDEAQSFAEINQQVGFFTKSCFVQANSIIELVVDQSDLSSLSLNKEKLNRVSTSAHLSDQPLSITHSGYYQIEANAFNFANTEVKSIYFDNQCIYSKEAQPCCIL